MPCDGVVSQEVLKRRMEAQKAIEDQLEIEKIYASFNTATSSVSFEVSESVYGSEYDQALAVIQEMKNSGWSDTCILASIRTSTTVSFEVISKIESIVSNAQAAGVSIGHGHSH